MENLLKNEEGATSIEYALIAGMLSLMTAFVIALACGLWTLIT